MRLTLRNMLACMDEILEPSQQEEIKKKIGESEFATGIMHRIREVSRRIRLGAPRLAGKGMGLDPNTVAMYLDNTLSADRVPDFEKVCLESDVHLAEVAACHQVLALVLGEPAEVNPALRQRLYGLAESAAAEAETAAPKGPPPLPPDVRRRYRPRVPDYLREDRRSRWWAVAATILLALILIGAVVRAMGPFDRTNPALAWLPIWGDEQIAQTDDGDSSAEPPPTSHANDDRPPGVPPNVEKDAADHKSVDAANVPAPNIDAAPAASQSASKAATSPAIVEPPPRPDNSAAATTPRDDAPPPATKVAADASEKTAADAAATERAAADAAPATTETPPAHSGAEPLGRFLTDPNVLLRLNRDAAWERVAQGATLSAGDRLLVLPTYRPNISLGAGLTLQILGETLVELVPADESGIAGLRLIYGRVVLLTSGKPDVALRLWLGDRKTTVTFVNADSTFAAEVRRFLPAGADPEQEHAYLAIDIYAASGDIDLAASENPQPKRISGPAHASLGTPYPYASPDEGDLPKWITADTLSGLDQLASVPMNTALREDRPVALTLREKLDDRRPELVYLAARSLALIDEFDPLIDALGDDNQKSAWPKLIESLQGALARGPDTAAKVREAFEKQRGEDGQGLYRMLRGYSKADIQHGAAGPLVEYLDHNSLDFRVLAFEALRSVPGVRAHFNYRPEGILADRRKAVGRWREYIKGDTSPLSAKGALDRPGPAPKSQPRPPVDEEPIGE